MLIADSSFLVALFLSNDTNHEKARKEIENRDDQILISNIILYETLTVINYKSGPDEKKQTYERISANSLFRLYTLDPLELQEILNEFISAKNKLSFANLSLVYSVRKMKQKVLTFDKELIRNL